ncbi:MAG: dTDP-4-dehydrorhamnose 3,5-epimerase [Patescibacteria group bacterium]
MKIKEKKFGGLFEIWLEPHEDERGFFMRTNDEKVFKEYGLNKNWVQESESFSRFKGTVRGMHFQYPPHVEAKAIRVVAGATFFAFVDLRKNSPTLGKWDSAILSAEKKNMIIIPRGFANGTCTLSENCTLIYKMDNYFDPESYDSIKWDDPDVGIVWPIKNPSVISEQDGKAQSFKEFLKKSGGGLSV